MEPDGNEIRRTTAAGSTNPRPDDKGILPAEAEGKLGQNELSLIEKIDEPEAFPSAAPDVMTLAEIVQLKPAEFAKYERVQFIEQMKEERERCAATITSQATEILRLHAVEVEHSALKKSKKMMRAIVAVCALATATGSGLMKFTEKEWLAFGFALLIIAAFVQITIAIVDG